MSPPKPFRTNKNEIAPSHSHITPRVPFVHLTLSAWVQQACATNRVKSTRPRFCDPRARMGISCSGPLPQIRVPSHGPMLQNKACFLVRAQAPLGPRKVKSRNRATSKRPQERADPQNGGPALF